MRLFINLLVGVIILSSCGGSTDSNLSGLMVESFPKVDLKDYDTISIDANSEFIIPYEFSIDNSLSSHVKLSYSRLIDEVKVEVGVYSIPEIERSQKARGLTISRDSVFIEFCAEQYQEMNERLTDVRSEEKYVSKLNDKETRYFRLTCLPNGFPKRKSLSVRFYKEKEKVYFIRFWSLEIDADRFMDVEDAIMLSFRVK